MEAVNSMLPDGDGETTEVDGEDALVEGEPLGKAIEAPEIDHEAEYIDEDRFTTVTVEAVEVSKGGVHRITEEDEESGDGSEARRGGRARSHIDVNNEKAKTDNKKRVWTKERPNGPNKKKKKFKYENKADRKITRHKERSKSKAQAKSRRE